MTAQVLASLIADEVITCVEGANADQRDALLVSADALEELAGIGEVCEQVFGLVAQLVRQRAEAVGDDTQAVEVRVLH